MNKIGILSLIILVSQICVAQTSFNNIQYWVGSGSDSAAVVVDFMDASSDSCYIWGYLFDEENQLSAADMLMAISDDEPMLDIALGTNTVNDINYNSHSGTIGAPSFWDTWVGAIDDSWVANSGTDISLVNGTIFGCSYGEQVEPTQPSLCIPAYFSGWFTEDEISYWIGDGSNTAIFVVDFIDDLNYGIPVRYAWGYKFDGEVTAEQMLADIASEDINLDINMAGGFLNDIEYIDQVGLAGAPYYWGTFSGSNLSNWTLNSGISEVLVDGSWFGCTYAEWEPPRPFTPLPATDPDSFLPSDVQDWIGTGQDSAVIVIDFNDGLPNESIAFGYLFNGVSTGEEAIMALGENIDDFDFNMEFGFLNDLTYSIHSGIGGAPYYWGTWSGDNVGGWFLNVGITTELTNGDWFGCTYTDFNPALPPQDVSSVILSVGELNVSDFDVYPNPFKDWLDVELPTDLNYTSTLYNIQGQEVVSPNNYYSKNRISTSHLESGIYFMVIKTKDDSLTIKLVKS